MISKRTIKVFVSSGVIHVTFAFVVMGAWAVFANRHHPMPGPLFAGLLQGGLSAAITSLMKKALDNLSARLFSHGKISAALIAPPLIVCSLSLTGLILSHVAAGTPEILTTIAVPFSVAFTYAWIYSFSLWRDRGKAE